MSGGKIAMKVSVLRRTFIVCLTFLLILGVIPPNTITANPSMDLPVSTIELLGNRGTNGIYYGNVQFTITATSDNRISQIQYKLSSKENWRTYIGAVTLAPGKSYEIFYRAVDANGNTEQPNSKVVSVKYDTRPPVSTAYIEEQSTSSGFYNKAVKIIISAEDIHSGIEKSEYSLDEGRTWTLYSSPVNISNDGQTIFYYRSVDNSGNIEKPQKLKVYMDLIPPNTPFIYYDPDDWTNESVTISIGNGNDVGSGSEKSEFRIDEGNWVEYFDPFSVSSPKKIEARTIDFAGNVSEIVEGKVKIDTTPPPPPFMNIGDWSSEPVYVDIEKEEDSESLVKLMEYQIESSSEWMTYYDPFKVETEGTTLIKARSIDWAGNISDVSEDFVLIDYTPPTNPTIILSNSAWTNQDVVFTIIDGEDELSGVQISQYKINDGAWTDYIVPVTVENEGVTTIYARTLDNLDHISNETTAEVKIDRTPGEPPAITLKRGGLLWDKPYNTGWFLNKGIVNISAGVDDRGVPYQIQYRIGLSGEWKDYTNEFTLNDITSEDIYAKTIDSAGNSSNLDIATLTNLRLNVSNGITLHSYYDKQVVFGHSNYKSMRLSSSNWDDETLKVTYYVSFHTSAGESQGSFSVDLSDKSLQKRWDTIAPSAPTNLRVDSISNTIIRFSWDPSNDNEGVKGYNIYNNGKFFGSTINTRYVAENLLINKEYNFSVKAVDMSGNLSNASVLRTSTSEDFEAPTTPQNLNVTKNNDGKYTLRWDKSIDNVAVQGYKIFVNAQYISSTNDNSYLLDLEENTEYQFYVQAFDEDGNISQPSETVVIITASDLELPSVPTGLQVEKINNSSVKLTWNTATDNVGVIAYNIYQNGEKMFTSERNEIIIENLSPYMSYKFAVTALDAASNESSLSQLVNYRYLGYSKILALSIDSTMNTTEDGQLWFWGAGNSGILEDGSIGNKHSAINIPNITNVTEVAIGSNHALILKDDGSVWSWGKNTYGQLGDGTTVNRSEPEKINTLSNVKQVAVNGNTSYAVKEDGTVWSWGLNTNGQLGIGSYENTLIPIQIDGLTNVIAISAGSSFVLALKEDGSLWGWGKNSSNQLGLESAVNNQLSPKQAHDISEVIDIATGNNHSLFIKIDGSVWSMGNSGVSQLNVATQVSELSDITSVSAGDGTSYALKSDGTVWSWGVNNYGQLGDGTTTPRSTPMKIEALSDVRDLVAGSSHVGVVKIDKSIWTWGRNQFGQLGNGTTINSSIPTKQIINTAPWVEMISPLGTEDEPTIFNTESVIFGWKQNDTALETVYTQFQVQVMSPTGEIVLDSGEINKQNNTNRGSWNSGTSLQKNKLYQVRARVKDEYLWSEWSEAGWMKVETKLETKALDLGNEQAIYVKEDGTVWMWGSNSGSISGDGTNKIKLSAVQVPGIDNVSKAVVGAAHVVALKKDGTVWTWGSNGYGELGTGTQITTPVMPRQITSLTNIVDVEANGSSSYVLKADGTVWAWGYNNAGQLGDWSVVNRTVPVQVQGLTGITALSAGNGFALALRSDGTVWGWGRNDSFNLGVANTANKTTPVQMTAVYDVVGIAAGWNHSVLLKADGSVWEVGDNGIISTSTAKQVEGVDSVVAVGAGSNNSYILKSDGTVWAWGSNSVGQLGNGTTVTSTAPVQVQGISGAIELSVIPGYAGVRTSDGTVWMWGRNAYGQLGDGTQTNRSTPVQMLENKAPTVALVYPLGTQTSPLISSIKQPVIGWIQEDETTVKMFTHLQVQIFNAAGTIVLDSGEIMQNSNSTRGSWTVTTALPVDQSLQVRVRVKDGHLWSEWSEAGWMKVETKLETKALDLGAEQAVYVKEDGTVWMWGSNSGSISGDGTNNIKLSAVQVPGIDNVSKAVVGAAHVVALKKDGTVWTWGSNGYGQLGTGTQITTPVMPRQIMSLTNIVDVEANGSSSYVLKADGTVWAWGYNNAGQLGDWSVVNRTAPVQVQGLTGITALSAGNGYALALRSDGTVWGWGRNDSFNLGVANTANKTTPVQMTAVYDVVGIAAGWNHSVLLKADGSVWEVGDNGIISTSTAKQVEGVDSVVAVGAGSNNSYILKSDGTVWAWGSNSVGQLGNGTTVTSTVPVQVQGISEAIELAVIPGYAGVRKSDGTVWMWGRNAYGQLGDGTQTNRSTPVQMLENTAPVASLVYPLGTQTSPLISSIKQPVIGWIQEDETTVKMFTHLQVQIFNAAGTIILDSGEIIQNSNSTRGSWTVTTALPVDQSLQVRVRVKDGHLWSEWSGAGWMKVETKLETKALDLGAEQAVYVKEDGTVWMWGSNSGGISGDGTNNIKLSAVQVPGIDNVSKAVVGSAHVVALKKDGTVWTWGSNGYGQLGTGTQITTPVMPRQITSLTNIVDVEANGSSSYVLKADGTVWAWGYNNAGQLGDWSVVNRTAPVQVQGLTGITALSAGNGYALALRSDGTVWGWGRNDSFNLGVANTANKTTPVQMTAVYDVVEIAAGWNHSVLLKADGSVWEVGNNGIISTSTAKQVEGVDSVVAVGAGSNNSYILKSDGTVWAWGTNSIGELGNGTTVTSTVPVQVQGISEAIELAVIPGYAGVRKSDGTVWMWGRNAYGQLGDGTQTNRSTPVKRL